MGSGSSSMSRPLNMPPFSVSLYMSLRTLPISWETEKKGKLSSGKWETLRGGGGGYKRFHVSFVRLSVLQGWWLTVTRIKRKRHLPEKTGARTACRETLATILHHNVEFNHRALWNLDLQSPLQVTPPPSTNNWRSWWTLHTKTFWQTKSMHSSGGVWSPWPRLWYLRDDTPAQ